MGSAQEISLPIKLEVLLSSIADLLKVLNTLQPNTSGWKSLSKIIETMKSDAIKLLALISMPFSSLKLFNLTEKTIDKMEEAAARVKVVMDSLQFSDLKLTPVLLDLFKQFETEINNIRAEYAKLLDDLKLQILSTGDNATLIGSLGDAKSVLASFDTIKSAVDEHVADLSAAVDKLLNLFNQLKSNIELGMRATALTSSTGGLTREALGDSIFNKFLKETANGILFKGGNSLGRESFLRAIEEAYKLEPGLLLHLAKLTFDLMNEAFLNYGKSNANPFSNLINLGNKGVRERGKTYTELEDLKKLLKEYLELATELDILKNNKIDPTDSINTARITEVEERMKLLKLTIFETATSGNSVFNGAMNSMVSLLSMFKSLLLASNAEFLKLQRILMSFNAMKMTIINFMGFNLVLLLTKRAVKEAAKHIKELDTVMNKISIVTNMDTSDLWALMDQYSAMAQKYGASIKGAYEVSLIYYQQGLDTNDVMTLTNETLKLAKISGLDYAASTDYMTTALRGFKMEMTEAATVVDVYSNLAANTAVSLEELAVAMSKTASSMESVGASFQESSAMIATMVAVTRESATNIGSAMKSIASRYGEMKKAPSLTLDEDGEEIDYNKVDTALKSVGISMKTTEGQFRNFTDVIIELGEKWDQLESTQQRYIATLFAGNRQQSRFLALVSNIDLLKSNLSYAEDSEDVGTMQALKALDSLESKIELVRVAYQQFYTTIGVESVWKGFLDGAKNVVNTLNRMPKLFNTLPIGAINAIANVIGLIKNLALHGLQGIANSIGNNLTNYLTASGSLAGSNWIENVFNAIRARISEARTVGLTVGLNLSSSLFTNVINNGFNDKSLVTNWVERAYSMANGGKLVSPEMLTWGWTNLANDIKNTGILTESGYNIIKSGGLDALTIIELIRTAILGEGDAATTAGNAFTQWAAQHNTAGKSLTSFGLALNLISLTIDTTSLGGKRLSGALLGIAGTAMLAGAAITTATNMAKEGATIMNSIPWVAVASGIIAVINGISLVILASSIEAQLEEFTSRAEELSNVAKELKTNYKTLDSSIKKYEELKLARYDSAEAAEEYLNAVDKIAEAYPSLIESYTLEGEAILNASAMEAALTEARSAAAEATLRAAEAEAARARVEKEKNKSDLYKSNDAFDDYRDVKTGWGDRFNYEKVVEIGREKGSEYVDNINEQLTSILYAMNLAVEDLNIDEIFKLDRAITSLLAGTGLELSDSLLKEREKILDAAINYLASDKIIAAAEKVLVSAYVNKKYNTDNKAINDNLLNLAKSKIYTDLKSNHLDVTNANIETKANELLSNTSLLWQTLSEEALDSINAILSNPENYTFKDLETVANKYGIKIDKWLEDVFVNKAEYNELQLREKTSNLITSKTISISSGHRISDILNTTETSLDQRQLLTSGLNLAVSLKKNGQSNEEFLSNFLSVYQSIAQVPALARNALIEQFTKNGFTREGLRKTLKYIEDEEISGVDTASILNIIDSTIPNIKLMINTAMSNLTEDLGDIESVTSNFLSGIKGSLLEKTIAKAKLLGMKFDRKTDFEQDGDKFIVRAERLEEEIENLKTLYTEQFNNSQENLDDAHKAVKANSYSIELAMTLFGGEFTTYFRLDENKHWQLKEDYAEGGEKRLDFLNAIDTIYSETSLELTDYYAWIDALSDLLLKTLQWKRGNYLSLTTLGLKSDNYTSAEKAFERIQYLSEHPDELTEEEAKAPDVLNSVENYLKGLNTLVTDISTKSADYINSHANLYEGLPETFVLDIAKKLNNGTLTTTEAIQSYANLLGKTIEETNQLIISGIEKNSKLGRLKTGADLIKGGFTRSDLNNYLASYMPGLIITDFLDNNGLLKGDLAKVFEYDANTDSFKKKAEVSVGEVVNAFNKTLGTDIYKSSLLYKELILDATNEAIKEADNADKVKLSLTLLSNLSNAKVGDRIDVSNLNNYILLSLKKSGLKITDNYIHITSEYALNAALSALEELENKPSLDPLEKENITRIVNAAKAKLSPAGALGDIIADTVSSSAADAWALTLGKNAVEAMNDLGYSWNAALNSYVSGANSIALLQAEVDKLEEKGSADPAIITRINELKTKIADMKKSQTTENINSLKEILNNYDSVSDEMIKNLANSLRVPRELILKYFKSRGDGTYVADISAITTDIENGVLTVLDGVVQLLSDSIEAAMNSYLSLFENAIDTIGKNDRYAAIKSKAQAIYSQMTDKEKILSGVKSAEDLIEFSKEEGAYRLNESGRKYEVEHISSLDEISKEADLRRRLIHQLNYYYTAGIEWNNSVLSNWMQLNGIEEGQRGELEKIIQEWNRRLASGENNLELKTAMLADIAELAEIKRKEALETLSKTIIPTIAEFDFESIAKGTSKDELFDKTKLKEYLAIAQIPQEILDQSFDKAFEGLKKGDWKEWETMVKNTKVEGILSTEKLKGLSKGDYDQYQQALADIEEKRIDSFTDWDDSSKTLWNELMGNAVKNRENALAFLIKIKDNLDSRTDGYETAEAARARNEKIELKTIANNVLRNANLLTLLTKKEGFTREDLAQFLQENFLDLNLSEVFDGESFIGDYAQLNEVTEFKNGVFKAKNVSSTDAANQYFSLFAEKFDATIEDTSIEALERARELVLEYTDRQNKAIEHLQAEDIGKFSSTALNTSFNATNIGKDILSKLAEEVGEGIIVEGQNIIFTTELARLRAIKWLYDNKDLLSTEGATEITKTYNDNLTKYDPIKAVASLMSKTITRETAEVANLALGWNTTTAEALDAQMQLFGFSVNGNEFNLDTADLSQLKALYTSLITKGKGTTEERNAIAMAYTNLLDSVDPFKQLYNALVSIINNGNQVTAENLNALATSLDLEDNNEELRKLFTFKENGEGIFDLHQFSELMQKEGISGKKLEEGVMSMVAPQIDTALLKGLTEAASLAFEGTNDAEAMDAMVTEFNRVTGGEATKQDLFGYDAVVDAYTFKLEKLNEYKEKIKEALGSEGQNINADAVLQRLVTKVAAAAIDVKGFMEADNRTEGSRAYNKLAKLLKDYYGEVDDAFIVSLIAIIENGGQEAVNLIQQIGKDADVDWTPEEIQAFYQPVVTRLINYRDALLNLLVGSYVALGDLKSILVSVGMVDAETGLVTSVKNLANAYLSIYNQLTNSATAAGATLQLKNETYAKYLNASEQKEIDAIDTLGKAMGMTYDEFATLLTNNGKELKTVLEQLTGYGIELLGNGKIRISDFTKFASLMGWSPQSEEYTSAFKSYNDALIERNKLVKEQVYEEVSLLKDIKPGDWMNLTYTVKEVKKFSKKLAKDTVRILKKSGNLEGIDITSAIQEAENTYFKSFGEKLAKAGAILDNGILQLTEDANLLGIAQVLQNAALDMGTEMSDELADMVLSIIQSYTEAINKGIEGGLTNVEKTDLVNKAADLGITELDFTETAEGLQLSQKSAIGLYRTISQIDRLQGKSVFNTLSKQLEESNSEYKTTTKLLAHIADLEELIKKANDERKKVLEEELAVAKEINAQRLIQSDADWNFMNNNALPGSFTNAIEYWQGWANASKTLNEAALKLRIDPSALATMFLHVYELAEATGQPRTFMGLSTANQSMSELLDMMGSIVTIDARTGEAVLTAQKLKSIGINLSLGAKGISDGVKDAAKEYAQMNANLIKKIHTFYSNLLNIREALDDKDLNWDDFFEGGKFNYDKFINTLGNESKAVKAFSEFADTVSINGKHLSELVKDRSITAQTSRMMLSIFTMMYSDDWDTETGYLTIAEHLASSGFNGELDLGDMLFSVRGKHVLSKASKDNKWTDSVTGKTYDTAAKAYAAINKRELDELTRNLERSGAGGKTDKGYDIEVDGQTYIFTVNTDGKIQYKDKNGTHTYNDISEFYDERYQKYSEEAGEQALSRKGWNVKQDASDLSLFKSGSTLTSSERELVKKFGLEKLENWQETWKEFNDQYGKDAVYELEALLGIKFELGEDGQVDQLVIDNLIKQVQVDEMAASVLAGITNAFTDESVAGAISSAIGLAFVGDNGVPIPEIKLNPENVGLAEGSSDKLLTAVTAAAKDLKADILGNTAPLKADVAAVTFPELTVNVRGKYTGTDGLPDGADDSSSTNKGFKKPGLGLNNNNNSVNIRTTSATGNIGLAQAKGTLMGELGPELVVSDGRYFVVGQSGPEMVDLAADAIVFNHLQTESLLTKGTSSGRGRAITNERTAVAYALGSRHGGVAKDSLEVAAELTSGAEPTWGAGFEILKNTDPTKNKDDLKAYVKEFERWYNWLQKIAHLEKEISFEEAKRTRYASDFIRSGADIYKSQIKTLEYLKQLLAVQRDLNKQRKEYNKTLRTQLNNSPFSLMYEFDENFLPIYKEGMYDFVSQLLGQDFTTNAGNYDIKEIHKKLQDMGYASMMEYDKSGNKIDTSKDGWEATAVQTIIEMMEKRNELALKAHDEEIEGDLKEEELQNSENEILKEIEDNQLAVEQKVLKAIEDSRERAIEDSKKERDAIEKANQKLIDGLNKQLENERTMRLNQKDTDELNTLQRRLAILQRSGGSASEIASLQLEITDKQYDKYFATLEQLIKAIEDASKAELDRLDNQISIMEETLEYEKLHGLLWNEVYDVLQGSPEDIATFILENDSSYWGLSLSNLEQVIRDDLKEIDKYKAFLEDTGADIKKLVGDVSKYIEDLKKEETSTEGNGEAANGQGTSGSNGGNKDGANNKGDSGNKKTQYEVMGMTFDSKEDAEAYLERWQKNANNKVTEASENYKADGSGSFYDALNNLAAWNNAVIKEISVDKNTKATGTLDDEAKKIKTEKVAEAEKIKSEKVAEEKTTKSGTTYYVYTDPNTGKTITGNAYYMKQKGVPGFSTGGLNNYTGLAVLHGTKDKPEAVLNASLTKVLRDNILGNRPDSLVNLLKSYNEAYRGLSSATYDSISNETNSSIIIERAEVNLQIDELANDYDARRAANTVMDELLQIARKTSASNRVGRR